MTEEDFSQETLPEENGSEGKISFGAMLVGLVLDPRRTFKAVAALPKPIIPIVILMAAALIFSVITRPVILEEMQSGEQIERMMERGNLSEAEAEKALETQQGIAKIGVLVGAPLNEVLSCLIFAALLLFVGNVVLGGSTSYVAVLAGYSWAKMIGIIGMVVKTPIILATDTLRVTLSPAILLPESAVEGWLYAVLSVFDVFHIWEAVLVCFAMAAVYKIGIQRAVGFVGTLYVVLAAVGVILRQLFGGVGV
jgi:hypothetical protein